MNSLMKASLNSFKPDVANSGFQDLGYSRTWCPDKLLINFDNNVFNYVRFLAIFPLVSKVRLIPKLK